MLLFGNHSTGDGYPRLRVLAEGLRAHGLEVPEVRVPMLEGEGQRVRAAGSPLGFLRAAVGAVAGRRRLREAYRGAPPHDAVLVGYPGVVSVGAARAGNRRGERPVVLDAFFSLHDAAVNDRGLARPGSWRAKVLLRADRAACRDADVVMVDTGEHARFFEREMEVPREKLLVVPVGAMPFDAAAPAPRSGGDLEVLFFGTYVPLQGVPVILDAAARLGGKGVRITLVGRGQGLPAAEERARALGLAPPAVEFVEEFLPRAALDGRIAAADVCLGVFGATAKASRVVPCKAYDALAAGKPLVTADTPAAREAIRDGEHALLVPAADPAALAAALERLRADPALRRRLAEGARRLWSERFSPMKVAEGLVERIGELCRDRPRTD